MAWLDDLSTELILDILGRIPPENLESTTFISRTVHQIARTLLDQHRKVLVKQYRDWDDTVVHLKSHPLHCCSHMNAGLLCTILTDQRLARMVKTLKAYNEASFYRAISETDREGAWRPDEQFPGSLPRLRRSQGLAKDVLGTRIQILEEAVCQCSLVSRIQKGMWLEKLHRGSEELATILLIWYLPALRSVKLALGSTEWTDIYGFLLQIAEYAVSISARPAPVHMATGLPLQNLDSVFLLFKSSRSEDIALIKAFLSLPRLSAFGCEKLSVTPVREGTAMRKLDELSTVNSLTFDDCMLDIADFFGLLEGVTAVRRFACIWYRNAISDAYDWVKFGPNAVVAALAGSIGHKLETLELRAWPYVEVQYIDTSLHFRDFRALKRLEISTNIILTEDGGSLNNFLFTLPGKLEYLLLYWIKLAPVPDILTFSRSLKTFIDLAKVLLTSLRRIAIYGYLGDNEMEELLGGKKKARSTIIGHLTLSVCSLTRYQ